jgi:hypothetical protein
MELAALQSVVSEPRSGLIGLPAPAGSPRFRRASRYSAARRPPPLTQWVHPLVSYVSPTEFSGPHLPANLSAASTFRGVPFPFATSTCGVHVREHPKLTSFRPRRFSRPRRFAPPPALRVCFTPQPRPGFALQGFPLRRSRTTSSVAVALVSSDRHSCRRLAPAAPELRPRLQGLAPRRSPLRLMGV